MNQKSKDRAESPAVLRRANIIAAFAVMGVLGGCAAPRQAPDAQGVSFPARESSYRSEGVVVSGETVRLLQPGLSKDQVRQLIGSPHFSEGLLGVREWNYILRMPGNDAALANCQLQLRFDEQNKVASTHWQSETCAVAAGKPASAMAAGTSATSGAPTLASARTEEWTEGGLVFPFGRSRLEDMRAADRARLKALVSRAARQPELVERVVVVGHADRVGPGPRKQLRSLDRANSVGEAFAAKGIAPALIEVVGRSDTEPLASCLSQQPLPDLLACLAPDRRVSVTVYMKKAD